MALYFLRMLAGVGAIAHVFFAFIEIFRWESSTVRRIAPSWIEGLNDIDLAEAHIAWAKPLAFNVGVYNLLLAIGLTWTAFGDATIVRSLATFFAIWLLGAAAAALYTRVVKACVLQGLLGLLLLLVSIWA
jgi:uncharacterized membrane protein